MPSILSLRPRRLLEIIKTHYAGGPVGIEALAATLNEEPDTLVDVVEPYLLKAGFLRRTGLSVDRTSGEILVYNNKILPAYFHATCAGMTEPASRPSKPAQ